MAAPAGSDPFPPLDDFARRHLGPAGDDVAAMLQTIGVASLAELIAETVPAAIRLGAPLALPPGAGEREVTARLAALAGRNRPFRSLLGMGYQASVLPAVVLRNVLENPGWYTQYTPYQAEISQGRLEALLNFQTVVADLTGLPIANASLLDEATAAAEAMHVCCAVRDVDDPVFLVSELCHPQTIAVVRTRAEAIGVTVEVGDHERFDFSSGRVVGALVQYPATDGRLFDYAPLAGRAHAAKALLVVAADLLALAVLRPPGEFGADLAVGTSQRLGLPLGYGGPHAGFLAAREEHKRQLPGRIIGISRDSAGEPALRMALQTREQHIRREKATSNICTAQALPAILSSFYAIYHGAEGLRAIAERMHRLAWALAGGLGRLGCRLPAEPFFDTLCAELPDGRPAAVVLAAARERGINLRALDEHRVVVALDELTDTAEVETLLEVFAGGAGHGLRLADLAGTRAALPAPHARSSAYLSHPVFRRHRTEHEMLRYIKRLEARDLSLAHSMIALGSCTMKLNATTEMVPITWPGFADIHPFAPVDQAAGYAELFRTLEGWLAEITGFHAVSLQPNAGAQGEYTGLLVIRAFHRARGEAHRDVCLIPVSAHGTNPASAVMAGMKVVAVSCDEHGNIDVEDLRLKAAAHAGKLSALMVTYPSTHGVFEAEIREICSIVHAHGGQVYMDGANMNAQVGLTRPAAIGADVCHLNLHKTFCIPHGGGGPGMGPIAVADHLAPFLPGHPVVACGGARAIGPVAAAPWGSASVLPISWAYVALMGGEGLTRATEIAILNANYMAARLAPHYPVLYTGTAGRVAHEFILDLRPFKASAGVEAEDVAKRLMDYGFHAPTMSFPVPGTLMVEPTESESRAELDRFCAAMIAIRAEIREIEEGRMDRRDNPLKNAPHTARSVVAGEWAHPYSREVAVFPAPWVRESKFWPAVGRIDNAWGDRNLVCTCPTVEELATVG